MQAGQEAIQKVKLEPACRDEGRGDDRIVNPYLDALTDESRRELARLQAGLADISPGSFHDFCTLFRQSMRPSRPRLLVKQPRHPLPRLHLSRIM